MVKVLRIGAFRWLTKSIVVVANLDAGWSSAGGPALMEGVCRRPPGTWNVPMLQLLPAGRRFVEVFVDLSGLYTFTSAVMPTASSLPRADALTALAAWIRALITALRGHDISYFEGQSKVARLRSRTQRLCGQDPDRVARHGRRYGRIIFEL